MHHGGLGAAVGAHGLGLVHDEGRVGGDVHDAAALAGVPHLLAYLIGHVDGAVQVGVQDAVPVGQLLVHIQQLADAGDARVVHQDLEAAEGVPGLGNNFPHVLQVHHVAAEALVLAAEGLQFLDGLGRLLGVPAEDGHVGALLGEGLGDGQAQAPVAAGDEGVLPLQGESVFHTGNGGNHSRSSFP